MSQSMGKNGLSLRYKILLVVTGLPLIALIVFYFMVIDLFKEDKQAYIYNQVQTNARAKASSVSAEIAASLDALAAIDQTVDPNKHAMTRTGHYVFYSIKEIVGFVSISVNEKGELLRSTRPYLKPQKGIGSLNPSQMNLYLYPQKVLHRLENRNILIQAMKGNHSYIAVTHRVKTLFGNRIVSGIFNKEALSLIFKNDGPEQIMLASNIHGLLLGEPDQDLFKSVHNFAKKSSIPEITKELLVNDTKYIISIIRTTLPDIYVSSGVLLEEAYKATEFLSWKTLIFCVALLSLTVIIAILSTQPVTRSIEGLSEATNKIASGDFDFKIKIASGGEIAQLASNFNSMASKIKSLLADTQDKARMEAELRTAQAVQKLLLPEPKFKTNDVEITGAAIAAEECGGDWWHHFQSEKYYFIFIGDATGHGAPAALITSAARSAVAMMEKMKIDDPAKILEGLSEAIFGTSKGNMVMTGFLARIDKATGELTYANASHDPPYLLNGNIKSPVKWKNLEPLMNNIGPRLGEHSDQTYTSDSFILSPGDRLLLYTDGIFEVKNKDGSELKERNFLKYCAELYSKPGRRSIVPKLVSYIESFNGQPTLADDITIISLDWNKV